MLTEQVRHIMDSSPEYAAIAPVIEKEILHHDIIDVMVNHGAMQSLTFTGGSSLRLCYNSSRISEDLEFNGGHDFKPSRFDGLETEIQKYLQRKYETDVWVNKPAEDKYGDTSSWKVCIDIETNRTDSPRKTMDIAVCSIPSFDVESRPLINHYHIVVPTEGLLVPVQSLQGTLADKVIALVYRGTRIKPQDLWDIIWIRQRGIDISTLLVDKKIEARGKDYKNFVEALRTQVDKLMQDAEVRSDFNMEISRSVAKPMQERTIDNPNYWTYVQSEIRSVSSLLLDRGKLQSKFGMNF